MENEHLWTAPDHIRMHGRLGSLCNCIDRVSPELEPVVAKARQSLSESEKRNIDETGWKRKGDRRTLWVFVSFLVVYFSIDASPGAKVLRSVLGIVFKGGITSIAAAIL